MKKLVRLTESDLHRIVRESVKRILKENDMYKNGMLSQKGSVAVNNINAQAEHERFLKKYTPNFTKRKKLKEYTGDFGYTDDNAPSNRPAIGTPEYYRRNDRMQIGQEPIYNDARNWDDPNYNRKQSIGDNKPFNANGGVEE